MQIERLIQMVFLLVEKGVITTRELADYFGVSRRTILRDINTLSLAGIPVYTSKGKGGGVQILKEYTIDKTILTGTEQEKIISSLQVLQATHFPNTEQLLTKISAIFRREQKPNWIEVDFSFYGSQENEKIKFRKIQESILDKYVMEFDYFTTELQTDRRRVEPLRLMFRYQAWYVFGYCRMRQDYRLFRTSRMKNICIIDEHFSRELRDADIDPDENRSDALQLFKLKFTPEIAHRIYDEYESKYVEISGDGSFIVTCWYEINEWLFRYLLSYGTYVEVLEPVEVRGLLKDRAKAIAAIYE